jgi:glycosyltransferase involved in cell wall biosynthesis
MRIAEVAPLCESVPPRLYGGTERVVSWLTDELVRQRHDVTLFASGDSQTTAKLVPVCPRALRLGQCVDSLTPHVLLVEEVARHADEFDVIHFHIAQLHFPVARRLATPHVTTLHGRLDLPELVPFFEEFQEVPLISISNAQRQPLPHANWIDTVYHGFPIDALPFHPGPGSYLAFLGRVSPEKRVDRAIAIAQACDMPIRIAAKVDPVDAEYYDREIKPLLNDPRVEFIGEIGETDKGEFLGNASALLFPIDWPEPFGLVMIEALACGTPVIAFNRASVPEILEDGVNAFIVDTLEDAIAATRRVHLLDRRACRRTFERRFNVTRMAEQYLEVFERVIAHRRPVVAA